jgi:hypothetical protein
MTDPTTLADALDFIAHFAWATFYGLSVGVGGYLLFILAMQRGDDD